MFLLLSLLCVCAFAKRNELLPYNPLPNPQSVVQHGNARFTVLTNRLIRMEYSTKATFEDRPTPAFVNRFLLKPTFSQSTSNGFLTITTSDLTLQYQLNQQFSPSSLKVSSQKAGFSWSFGDKNDGNLLGTIKSLDNLDVISLNCTENAGTRVHDESLHCSWGLISRQGWSVVNDTNNWGINNNDWWDTPNTDLHDLYFFGHGSDYKGALADYSQVGGKTALVPRNAIGIWWSRWYNINNNQVKEIVKDYQRYNFPLDVYILDMDWHTKEGWGGYTFDTRLFPIPAATMSWLHDMGLHAGANLHDDDGVRSTEKMYAQMALALGINPTSGQTLAPIIANYTYMYALEDIVLRDVEKQGMDFWWIDWQQGGTQGGCAGGKQNPTIVLNKVRGTDDIRRESNLRGIVLARWGGLGNHRYQIGFSGDVGELSWGNLAYQPYFSLTASNVGYGYWSHDLVGPPVDHELHTRWIQWGAYSGIFRTHDRGMAVGGCANANPPTCSIVEVWNLPRDYLEANRKAMHAREELIPYMYNCLRTAYDTGVSIIRPMYYYFPEQANAYLADDNGNFGQYFFGEDMFIAPVTTPGLSNTSMARSTIWIPPGNWIEKETGKMLTGSSSGTTFLTKSFDLSEIPVFYRAGVVISAIPLHLGDMVGLAQRQYTSLLFYVYPGETQGATRVYEDDGQTTDYLQNKFSFTTVTYTRSNTASQSKITITIEQPKGSFTQLPAARNYIIRLVNHLPVVSGTINGEMISYSRHGGYATWNYDGVEMTTVIETPIYPTTTQVDITIVTNLVNDQLMSGVKGRLYHSILAKDVLDETNDTPGSFTVSGGALDLSASTAELLTYLAGTSPNGFTSTLQNYTNVFNAALQEVQGLKPPSPAPANALVQLWNADRQDNCLCASQGCQDSNTQYQQVRIEGYQPNAGTPGTVPLNDYWNQAISDNYATTQTTTPNGYTPAVFADGYVFSSQQPNTVPLKLYWSEQRKDMLTVASAAGIQYAEQNNYSLVSSALGYVYTNPPTEVGAVNYNHWAQAMELMNTANN